MGYNFLDNVAIVRIFDKYGFIDKNGSLDI
jgi:hypothetical protein